MRSNRIDSSMRRIPDAHTVHQGFFFLPPLIRYQPHLNPGAAFFVSGSLPQLPLYAKPVGTGRLRLLQHLFRMVRSSMMKTL